MQINGKDDLIKNLEDAKTLEQLLAYDPDFMALLDTFRTEIGAWAPPPGSTIICLAADGGYFSVIAAQAFPHCSLLHWGEGAHFDSLVKTKRRRHGLENLFVLSADSSGAKAGQLDIYAVVFADIFGMLGESRARLHKLREFLKPGGKMFACEFSGDYHQQAWPWFLFKHNLKTQGFKKSFRLAAKGQCLYERMGKSASHNAGPPNASQTLSDLQTLVKAAGFRRTRFARAGAGCDWVAGEAEDSCATQPALVQTQEPALAD